MGVLERFTQTTSERYGDHDYGHEFDDDSKHQIRVRWPLPMATLQWIDSEGVSLLRVLIDSIVDENVMDTNKIDYYVKNTFDLFRLSKQNLVFDYYPLHRNEGPLKEAISLLME